MMGKVKIQPTDWVVLPLHPTPLPTLMAVAGIFWRLDLNSFTIFAHDSFNSSAVLFNYILSVLWWERWKRIPQAEFGHPLLSQPCQHQWAAAGVFWRLYLISYNFFVHVYLLNTHCSVMWMVKTQLTDWVWPPALITALPSLRGSSGYILRVVFIVFPFFCNGF